MPGSDFQLHPDITFLNFGSFGACAKPIFKNYQHWQSELEKEPVQFLTVTGPAHLQTAREALGKYVGCAADDLVFVTNPSYAMNIVARNLNLQEGDEVLTTDLEYGACDRIFRYYCEEKKAIYRQQPITLPLTTKEKFISDFFAGWTTKTKVIFISHITSASALILPVKEIVAEARRRGAIAIVDGAHVPGQLALNLQDLKADIYTGACHKWMLCPKGCSFLYVTKSLQSQMDPLVISWGYESENPGPSQFLDYHQMQGTRDFSAFLTVPAAIAYLQENNWEEKSAHCRNLVLKNAARFCELMKTPALCPLTVEFVPQLFSIPIQTSDPVQLKQVLYSDYQIEIPVTRLHQNYFIRYSIQVFNTQKDLDRLYEVMEELMQKHPALLRPLEH